MMLLHLAAHLYGVPWLIHRPKLDLILAVLGQRMLPSAGPMLPTTLPWSKPEQPSRDVPEGVAVLDIHGTLVRRTLGLDARSGLTSYPAIADALESALADPAVEGIFLDVDSAGGEAGGVFDLVDRVYAARQLKPIWAIADDMAFSAAYAIASAAERVWITRTGGVGSIGVIALHVDQSLKDAEDGLKYTPTFAGSRKNDLNPHEPLKDDARVRLQVEVDRIYDLFLATIARNRQQSMASIRSTEAGLFYGPESLKQGLADAIGSRSEALQAFSTYLATRQPSAVAAGSLLVSPRAQRPVALLSLPKETTMSDPQQDTSEHPQLPQPPQLHQLHQTIQSGPVSLSLTTLEAVEIAQLCTLAGYPERIVTFLETGSRPEQVRKALLDTKAQSAPEILIWLDGHSPAPQTETGSNNPMVTAAKRLAERQTRKEP
jgi:ClpP class serine protease